MLLSIGIIKFSLVDISIFLFYQWFIMMFLTPLWGSRRNFVMDIRRGKFTQVLTLPVNPILYEILKGYYLPLGSIIQASFYLTVALFLGFKPNLDFLLGLLSSFLAISLGCIYL